MHREPTRMTKGERAREREKEGEAFNLGVFCVAENKQRKRTTRNSSVAS